MTYTAADGPFAIGREWPTGFLSAAGASLSWTPPNAPDKYYVRAEVFYVDTTVLDADTTDNVIVTLLTSDPAPCTSVLTPQCLSLASGQTFSVCPDTQLVHFCDRYPPNCEPFEIRPVLCAIVHCPPLPCLSCPPEAFEVLFDNRANDLRLVLLDQDGKQVATMAALERPIVVGKQAFNERLRFMYKPGATYHVGISPGDKTNKTMGHALPLYVRRAKTQAGEKSPLGSKQD